MESSGSENTQTEVNEPVVVNEVVNDPKVGDLVGQCKWWSDKLGYGFITVQAGEMKGKDIFVHHSGIKPLNSNYKTLNKGEYVNFDVTEGMNGLQAVNVTGIGGGSLICDVNPHIKHVIQSDVDVVMPNMPSSPPARMHSVPFIPYSQVRRDTPPPPGGRGSSGGRGSGRLMSAPSTRPPYFSR